jgi:hypothetical protein
MVINARGEICSFCLTPGKGDERNGEVIDRLCRELRGKRFGDRGYISREVFERLYERGIQLIPLLRKNMKKVLMDKGNKVLLWKGAGKESVNDF